MDSIHICGGNRLQGELTVQGSKNAALPLLAACVLIEGVSVIENCPQITDVFYMIKLLESIGCKVETEGSKVIVDAGNIYNCTLPSEYVTVMRSSVVLMGALIGRCQTAVLNYPGGCVIGERPIDLHIWGFRQLGVDITEQDCNIFGYSENLRGNEITFRFPSVGASQNIIMAAVLAKGDTVLRNYAKEPEVFALCDFLNKAGAQICNFGNDALIIRGCKKLHPITYKTPSDRIVAGTYLFGCQAVGGNITLLNAPAEDMAAIFKILEKMGSKLNIENDIISIETKQRSKAVPYTQTKVYPGFPTDLQSPFMTALSVADGIGVVEETIFESRLKVVKELKKMGADIIIQGNWAIVKGVSKLFGRQVEAEELRGGAALVLAGLCAKETTIVKNRHFIDRGYEDIVKDLRALGADII